MDLSRRNREAADWTSPWLEGRRLGPHRFRNPIARTEADMRQAHELSRWVWIGALLLGLSGTSGAPVAWAVDSGEAQWIWFPERDPHAVPATTRYFRKSWIFTAPESGRIEITCDDSYVLYVNGQRIGAGNQWQQLDSYDLLPYLVPGQNVIAVVATNDTAGSSAGLMARVIVKSRGHTAISYSTDATWKSASKEYTNWTGRNFNDSRWVAARSLGEFGQAAPWGDQVQVAGGKAKGRFTMPPGFRIERVTQPADTGSLIACTFNEQGQIVAARERGPILLIRDNNGDAIPEHVQVYSELVKNAQGLLCLNGYVFAIGDGPEGTALYRLSDEDGDGTGEKCAKILKFSGEMSEHGPHTLVLGPEGLLYVVVGNHSQVEMKYASSSPYHHVYEGDLVQPRFEDASGHAKGIKAPGGTIFRTDLNGSFCELVAGGLRNCYDLAFNEDGELFTHDSDMEWDLGLPWYRPTRVLHVIPGGEYGWRSGWAPFADYYLDQVPAVVATGRGSPTGLEFYHHHKYPAKYRGALFCGDWAQGRILAVLPQRKNGSYQATAEIFVQGQPLNVTDLAVGPDGWLYFVTGGRGTEGGVYRVAYQGSDVPQVAQVSGALQAVRLPQLHSAWARDRIARYREALGPVWETELQKVLDNAQASADDRCRVLDLFQLVGPFPSKANLIALSRDADVRVRAKAACWMGIHVDNATVVRLKEMLSDPDPLVRRHVCESLVRARSAAPVVTLLPRLADPQPAVRYAAARALQKVPRSEWQKQVLTSPSVRVFTMGSAALLALEPDLSTCRDIIQRYRAFARTYVTDPDFLDLLRVLQLALRQGQFLPEELNGFRTELAQEYPSADARMNRELLRLLVSLQEPNFLSRGLEELAKTSVPLEDRLHLAMHLSCIRSGWRLQQELELLRFMEQIRESPSGHNMVGYLDNAAREMIRSLSGDEQLRLLVGGAKMPGMALQILRDLPEELTEEQIEALIGLDQEVAQVNTHSARDLGTGLVAILGTAKSPRGLEYVRQIFEHYPERRQDVAMVLSSLPTETRDENIKNWPLMVRAIPVLEGPAAQMVMKTIVRIPFKPKKGEQFRQVLLAGLRMPDLGYRDAVAVLKLWTGAEVGPPEGSREEVLAAWQEWFAKTYPELPPATIAESSVANNWNARELLDFLEGPVGKQGNPLKGALIFAGKGQCAKCHRFGPAGETIGPDLTTVSRRFQKREVLESVLFPSQIISDQYASQTIVTKKGLTHFGIVQSLSDGRYIVLQSDGTKVGLRDDEIEEATITPRSAMPEGLFNQLTLEEIADLFAYLYSQPAVAQTPGEPVPR